MILVDCAVPACARRRSISNSASITARSATGHDNGSEISGLRTYTKEMAAAREAQSVLWLRLPRLVRPGGDILRLRPALPRIRRGRWLERLLMHRAVGH